MRPNNVYRPLAWDNNAIVRLSLQFLRVWKAVSAIYWVVLRRWHTKAAQRVRGGHCSGCVERGHWCVVSFPGQRLGRWLTGHQMSLFTFQMQKREELITISMSALVRMCGLEANNCCRQLSLWESVNVEKIRYSLLEWILHFIWAFLLAFMWNGMM